MNHHEQDILAIEKATLKCVRELLETHDDPVVLIGEDYSILAANQAYRSAYSIDETALAGRRCHEVSHHSDVPCHERGEDCPLRRARATGRSVDTLHIHFGKLDAPERVRIRGTPIHIGERMLLLERIERLDAPGKSTRVVHRMLGESSAFLTLLQRLIQASALPGSVLLLGESGVGKELAARFVHEHSSRASGPFVVVDCTAIPEALFERELFGHEKGAFTGSGAARAGLFETAADGTLFLDEVGELPIALQAKLLRAIETGEFRRLGAQQTSRAKVRILAATHRDPAAMVRDGRFRLDLYYRLASHEIRLPALRERPEDIGPIARALLAEFGLEPAPSIEPSAIALLRQQAFPGNIRELRNLLQRALAFGPTIDASSLNRALTSGEITNKADATAPLVTASAEPDRAAAVGPGGALRTARFAMLGESLARHQGNRARTAAELGVSERTVYRWMRELADAPTGAQALPQTSSATSTTRRNFSR